MSVDASESELPPSRPWVSVERRGKVAIVRIDRPRVNALSIELLEQLDEVFVSLSQELPGAVVIWGGDRVFAAGADITELAGSEQATLLSEAFSRAFDAIAAFPRVTIAAVCGVALGGGCELALACDLRVAGANTRFGLPEVLLGIFPGAGGTQRLSRLIGPGRAKDLIFSGRSVSAEESLAIGLVERVVESELVFETAVKLAEEFAHGAIVAQSLAKLAIDRGSDLSLTEGLALERELFMRVLNTNDAQRGIASFLANGPGKAEFFGD